MGVGCEKNFSRNRTRVQCKMSQNKINRLYLLDIYYALDIMFSILDTWKRQTLE